MSVGEEESLSLSWSCIRRTVFFRPGLDWTSRLGLGGVDSVSVAAPAARHTRLGENRKGGCTYSTIDLSLDEQSEILGVDEKGWQEWARVQNGICP